MREILFRGKRKDNGEWVCGDLIHHDGYVAIWDKNASYVEDFEVIPETVGQCIYDLTDKNGKNIFEGDILHYECSDVIAAVKFGLYTLTDKFTNSIFEAYGFYTEFSEIDIGGTKEKVQESMSKLESDQDLGCEVIGNIHDSLEFKENFS